MFQLQTNQMNYSPMKIRVRPCNLDEKKESVSNYVEIKTLGSGAFANVTLCKNNSNGKLVALKKVISSKSQVMLVNEVAAGSLLKHPNIATMYESFYFMGKLHIALEFVQGKDLYDLMDSCSFQPFTHALTKYIMYQLVDALEYCHSKGIVHRDIKLENIMITRKRKIKLIDFGLCHLQANERLLDTYVGSLDYAAPEVLMRKPYRGDKVDVFSLGVVFHILTYGLLPFGKNRFESIKKGTSPEPLFPEGEAYKNVSPYQIDLIRQMILPSPNTRPSMTEIKKHPWLKNVVFSNVFTQIACFFDSF